MAWIEPKKIKIVKTPEAAIKFGAKILEEPVRSIRLCRISGSETDKEYGMAFFVWGIIIDRYEVRFRNGTYTIFDTFTWAK